VSLRPVGDGCAIRVRVQPRAGRDEIVGPYGSVLRVRVAAPPLAGRANDALVRLMAKTLRVRRGAVEVTAGHRGRLKTVVVRGLSPGEVRSRLGL